MAAQYQHDEYNLLFHLPGSRVEEKQLEVVEPNGSVRVRSIKRRKKCPHSDIASVNEKLLCRNCLVEVEQCTDCHKLFSPSTIAKYGDCCGRCFKKRPVENFWVPPNDVQMMSVCENCQQEFDGEENELCAPCAEAMYETLVRSRLEEILRSVHH